MYPRQDESSNKGKDQNIVDKGKERVSTKKVERMPLKENPSGTGSSKAFEAPPSEQPLVTKNLAENSFSFASQNVTDKVQQRLPSIEPILTLATVDPDAEVSPEGNNTAPVGNVTKSSMATTSLLHVEHVDMEEVPFVDPGDKDTIYPGCR